MASALEILLGLGAAYGAFRRGRQEREDRRLQRDYYRSQRDAAEADRQQRRRDEIAQPVEQLAQLYPTAAPQLYQRSADLRRGTYLPGAPSAAEQLDSDPAAQISLPFTTPAAASGQRAGSLLGGVALGPSRYDLQRRETQDRDAAERAAAERADAVRGGLATFGALTHGRVGADPAEIARLGQQAVSGKPLAPNPALLGRTDSEVDAERRTAEAKAREIRDRQNQRLRIAGGLITGLKGVSDNYRQTLSTVLAQGGDVSDQLSTFLRQGGILPPSILADIARWQADPDPNAPLPTSLQQLAGFGALVDQSGGAPPPAQIAPPPLTGAGPRPGGLNPTLWNNLRSSGSAATVAAGPPAADPSPSARRELFPLGTEAQSRIADRPIGRQLQRDRVADQKAASALSAQDRRVRIELEKQRIELQRKSGERDQARLGLAQAKAGAGSGRTANGALTGVTRQRIRDADAELDHARSLWADFVKQNPFDAPEWIKYPADEQRRDRLYSDVASGKNKSTDHHYAAQILRRIEMAERAAQAERERAGIITGPPAPRTQPGAAGKDAVRSQYEQMGVTDREIRIPAPSSPTRTTPPRPAAKQAPPRARAASSPWSPEKRESRLDVISRFTKKYGKAPTPAQQRLMFQRIEELKRKPTSQPSLFDVQPYY